MKIVAKPIEVVAVFKPGMNPQPRRFRFCRDDKENQVVEIERINSVESQNIGGIPSIVYACQAQGKLFDLKYIINQCQWQLYRI